MEIGSPYKILGEIDVSEFTEFLDNNHPAWPNKKDDLRSNRFETHESTKSILFKWTERGNWPELTPKEYDIWHTKKDAIKKLCSLVSKKLPLNFMIAELEAKSKVHKHCDIHPFFAWARRIHVPLYVPEGVEFIIDNVHVPLKAGTMFEISNTRYHEVINPSDENRYHIIMDFPP
jgi:hypothetical protein